VAKRTTAEQRDKAIAAAQVYGTVRAAWMAAGVSRSTVYSWIDQDPEFSERWHLALEDYEDSLQDNLTDQMLERGGKSQYIAAISLANNKHRDFMTRKQEWLEQCVSPILEMIGRRLRERLPAAEASSISSQIVAEATEMVCLGSARKIK